MDANAIVFISGFGIFNGNFIWEHKTIMFNVYFQTENGIRIWHGTAHDQQDAFRRAYRWVIDNGNDYIVDYDIEEEG